MHSQEPGRTGSGMSCVTLQTITSVFKYPIQYVVINFLKKNSGEKTYQKSSKQVIINTNSSKPGKIAASSIGVTVHQTVFVCQWSWMVSGRTDKSSYDSADREDSLWLQREEGLRLWSILRMTMPSETPISNSTNTEADLLPSVPRRVIQVWKHTGVSV